MMHGVLRALRLVPLLLAAIPALGVGQARAHRTSEPLHLDGRPDESVWLAADSVTEFTQQDPVEGAPASERTVVRFLATDAGLWVAFWAYDRDPSRIRHAQLRRDADLDSDDRVGVLLNPQLDRRTGYAFIVNPNGALLDGEIRNAEDLNEDWNGVWDARARIGPDGWTAELFIPWQTLRYPSDGDTWGVNVARFIRHANSEVLWRSWRRQQGFFHQADAGTLTGLGPLPGRSRVELRPYATMTAQAASRTWLASGADSVTSRANAESRYGLDAKLAVAPTVTLDLTAHTDFAQVEADRQVVNLTRFPLFFPEQRPFFLEAGGLFDFGQSQRTMLFYSRRIGLGPGGVPVPIEAGARLTGRVGRERIGLLVARTGGLENAVDVAARVRHDVFARGYVGGIVTGQGGPGVAGTRRSTGVDFEVPLLVGGQNLVPAGFVAWTGNGAGGPATAWRLFLDYPNDWSDDFLAVNYVGPGFDPALGFVRETGYWRHTGAVRFMPRTRRFGLRRLVVKPIEWDVTTNVGGGLSHAFYEVRPLGGEFESGDEWELNLQRIVDVVPAPAVPEDSFEIFPGHIVAPGRYDYDRIELQLQSSQARLVSVELQLDAGRFYTGHGTGVQVGAEVRAAPHVVAGLDYEHSSVRLATGRFTAQAVRIRLDYAATARLASTLFVQWDNESDRLTVNARLHWIPRPGSDAYLVWNSAWPTGLPGRGIPWSRPQRGALVGKVVWFFRS